MLLHMLRNVPLPERVKFSISKGKYATKTVYNETNAGFQKHHVITRNAGGALTRFNIVALSYIDHCEAHWLRYQVYGEYGDL
jgi:hypothetical protein